MDSSSAFRPACAGRTPRAPCICPAAATADRSRHDPPLPAIRPGLVQQESAGSGDFAPVARAALPAPGEPRRTLVVAAVFRRRLCRAESRSWDFRRQPARPLRAVRAVHRPRRFTIRCGARPERPSRRDFGGAIPVGRGRSPPPSHGRIRHLFGFGQVFRRRPAIRARPPRSLRQRRRCIERPHVPERGGPPRGDGLLGHFPVARRL